MPPVHNAETLERDQASVALINIESAATIVAIASALLVLVSGMQSKELIDRRYRAQGGQSQDDQPQDNRSQDNQPQDNQRPPGSPQPARTALQSLVLAIISMCILTWTAAERVRQRQKDDMEGIEPSGELWPSIAILVGFFITIIATAFKALAVGQRYREEAQAVIF